MYQVHHVALLPGVLFLLEHSKRVKTSLPRPPSLYKWFLKSEDAFKSIPGAPTSPSDRDILTPDQNNLLWLYVSKTTSQEMRCGFRSIPSLDIINKIKFYYVRRTIKINWKGQLKEVPKLVWGNTMNPSQRHCETTTTKRAYILRIGFCYQKRKTIWHIFLGQVSGRKYGRNGWIIANQNGKVKITDIPH